MTRGALSFIKLPSNKMEGGIHKCVHQEESLQGLVTKFSPVQRVNPELVH